MQIILKKTDRNFLRGEFYDEYEKKCSIQKSSIATMDAIWLGIDDPEIVSFSGKKIKLPEECTIFSRMHLSQEMAKALLPHLQRFIKTGEL